jgi:flagellar basal body-associated protein FliL
MFKKHKYKFLAVLILFVVVGGGAVYYFKKKEATKKAEAIKEEEPTKKPVEQPKEPITTTEVEKSKGANPVKKDLVLTKGEQQLSKAK